ncbi:MAG: GerMN domain-containing protein [Acetomicrobium sp.]|jgi:hypothetical protein|uniref:GerMN domain-containing protein n=1 Tax=Acetomicrobium sp. TaxID=1872099 RepID=UPI002B25F92F|nr:GerMN domain-containing protein [Acetomicrobium sp.]
MRNKELPRRRDKEQKKISKKAPLPYRIIAWACLIMILFGLGYYGSGLMLKIFGKKLYIPGEIIVEKNEEGSGETFKTERHVAEIKLFLPENGTLGVTTYRLVPSIPEEDIVASLEQWISLMRSKGLMEGNSRILHVFRNGEIMYLNMSAPFYSSLQKLNKDEALLFMTALLRTIVENFDPIKEVKFLVEGKDVIITAPVDLSVSWRLAPRS